jgi:hypothetical protein
MTVVKLLLAGLYGRKAAEDKNAAVFVVNGREAVGHVLVFHLPHLRETMMTQDSDIFPAIYPL